MSALDAHGDPPFRGLLRRRAVRRRRFARRAALLVGEFSPRLSRRQPRAWELDPRMFAEPLPSFANARSARVAGGLGTMPRLVGEGLDIYPAVCRFEEGRPHRTLYKPYPRPEAL
jgi:N-formylglutamate amidohydrolase